MFILVIKLTLAGAMLTAVWKEPFATEDACLDYAPQAVEQITDDMQKQGLPVQDFSIAYRCQPDK